MTRRVDPDFQFPEAPQRCFEWQKWLTIAVIALLIATAAFFLYKNIRA
jgi:hypothetical protein